jgi:uncharacterized protein
VAINISVLADTSGIIALLDQDDRHHSAVVKIVRTYSILIPATILPEVDYLSGKYLGEAVSRAFLEDLTQGYFTFLSVDLADIAQAIKVMARYQGVPLGLVDASLVALAERYSLQRIVTLDRRHFSLIKPEGMEYLELLP